MRHTLTSRIGDNWVVSARESPDADWSVVTKEPAGRLKEALDASLAACDPLRDNWTFSERDFSLVSEDLAERPADVTGIDRGVAVAIVAREGRYEADDDRYTWLARHPGRAWFDTTGAVLRPISVRKEILEWFGLGLRDETLWKSFHPNGKFGVRRPIYPRELWARPEWRGRMLCPQGYPPVREVSDIR
jgi:hypothetical protein